MEQELVLTRGIPASGKSTFARAWVTAAPKRVRVNRDDIRMQLFGVEHGCDEEFVTVIEDAMVTNALQAGQSVIVDDTNIRHAYVKRLASLGHAEGVKVTVKEFPIDLAVALERNANRDRKVPEDVIRKMHNALRSSGPVDVSAPVVEQYEPKPGAPKAILVDIDGTIAHNAGKRGFYDWKAVGLDEPILEIIEIVSWAKLAGFTVIVMSGRDGICEPETSDWLDKHDVPYDLLVMRGVGDMRKDSIIKRELFDEWVRDVYNVQFVLDDRQQVVNMWRAMGLRCLQVAPGNF